MSAADPYAAIAGRVVPGATLLRRWTLEGGVSASVEALELALPDGSRHRVVVRRHGAAEWKPLEEDVTETEHALLEALHAAGMRVPEPLLLDTSCERLPSPYLVMELIDGTTHVEDADLPDALDQMADFLARLHAVDVRELHVPDLPCRNDELSTPLPHPPNAPALLHGDFWPGNILWKDGRIAAVIDWEDAAVGDPLSDLACSRLELLWKHGESAMDDFTARYLSRSPVDPANLPCWEVYVATAAGASMADWGLDPDVEADMRRKAQQLAEAARQRTTSRS